jgi:hypothetical protein
MRSSKRKRLLRTGRKAGDQIVRDPTGKFVKGVCPNPGGRPKGRSEFAALAREHAPECLQRLMYWVRSSKETASVNAARIVIERGYGRAESSDQLPQLITDGDDDRPSVIVRFIPPDHPADEDNE